MFCVFIFSLAYDQRCTCERLVHCGALWVVCTSSCVDTARAIKNCSSLQANKTRMDDINATGHELIESKHYAADQVQQRLADVHDLWADLVQATKQKGDARLLSRFCTSQD